MIKLGMGDVMWSGLVALWRGGWRMALCLVLWFSVGLASEIGQHLFDPLAQWFGWQSVRLLDHLPWSARRILGLTYLATVGFRDLVACVFIAGMLRIILTGRAGPWTLGRDGLIGAGATVLLVSLAVSAMTDGLPWLIYAISSGRLLGSYFGALDGLLMLLFAITLVYSCARLCMIYPSVAVGRGWALRRHWQATSGHGIRLSMVFVLVLLTYLFANSLVEVLLFRDHTYLNTDGFAVLDWRHTAKNVLARISVTSVLLAFSAVVFARLAEYPAAGIPGSSRTPEQLAEAFD